VPSSFWLEVPPSLSWRSSPLFGDSFRRVSTWSPPQGELPMNNDRRPVAAVLLRTGLILGVALVLGWSLGCSYGVSRARQAARGPHARATSCAGWRRGSSPEPEETKKRQPPAWLNIPAPDDLKPQEEKAPDASGGTKELPQTWHRDRKQPTFARVYVGDNTSL